MNIREQFPRFFNRDGTISKKVDRKTREVLAQAMLGDKFTLIKYATAFSNVKCNDCGHTFATRDLENTRCEKPEPFNYPLHTDLKHNNILYIWKVAGLPIYKLGVTSNYLKDTRIQEVARRQGVTPETIAYIQHPYALEIEILAKQLFKPNRTKVFISGDGYSEFYDFKDIKKVLRQIDDIIETIPDPT
ncbi:hypothetical protein VPHD51_0194 [Vibrio phage D51]